MKSKTHTKNSSDAKQVYVYTFSLGNKKYGFTSFHKSKALAKLDFIIQYLFADPWELTEIKS